MTANNCFDFHKRNQHTNRALRFSSTSSSSPSSSMMNPGLASVISQGISSLEQTARLIEQNTKHQSLPTPSVPVSASNSNIQSKSAILPSGNQKTKNPRQQAEEERILQAALECLEEAFYGNHHRHHNPNNGLHVNGEPIVFLQCQVNSNIRQAKLYWTIPLELFLNMSLPQQSLNPTQPQRRLRLTRERYIQLTTRLMTFQQQPQGGGTAWLNKQVHLKLRGYYPPRIKLVPATDIMIQQALQEWNDDNISIKKR